MTREEFEKKYLLHNFFWIKDKKQSDELQKIFIEFGYTNPIGTFEIIDYHKSLLNLVTFQSNEWHKNKFFQRVDIYNPNYSYGENVNYDEFIKDYRELEN